LQGELAAGDVLVSVEGTTDLASVVDAGLLATTRLTLYKGASFVAIRSMKFEQLVLT
jgi:hypothetical protein